MIVEVEIIEQISDEPLGRPMRWLIDYMKSIDNRDPYHVLAGMWRAEQLELRDRDGVLLPRWKVEQLIRDGAFDGSERVLATQQGLSFAYGEEA